MLNSGSQNPNIQDAGILSREAGTMVTERVGIIFEHSLERIDERTIQDLTHLLNHSGSEITLIHTLHEPWFGVPLKTDDPSLLSKYVQEQEQVQTEIKAELANFIRQKGFNLTKEYAYTLQDSNLQSLVDQINQVPQDLLILCG